MSPLYVVMRRVSTPAAVPAAYDGLLWSPSSYWNAVSYRARMMLELRTMSGAAPLASSHARNSRLSRLSNAASGSRMSSTRPRMNAWPMSRRSRTTLTAVPALAVAAGPCLNDWLSSVSRSTIDSRCSASCLLGSESNASAQRCVAFTTSRKLWAPALLRKFASAPPGVSIGRNAAARPKASVMRVPNPV